MKHERSGGAILDMSLHDVDFAIHALGKPKLLTAGGTVGKTGGIDDIAAVWEYDDAMVSIRCSWKAQAFAMSFQAFFENAAMDFGMAPDTALRLRRAGATEDEKVSVESVTGYVREMQYFLDCVRGMQVNTLCPAESTRDSIAMIELERKAIKAHRWVKVA
jgi:predicted dehydrogenase